MLGFGALGQFAIGEYNRETVAYALQCSAGSFTLTGQSTTGVHDYAVVTSPGSFTLTGIDVTLAYGRVLTASAGSYALTGQSATLQYGRVVNAGAGSYTLTGIDATLAVGYVLQAGHFIEITRTKQFGVAALGEIGLGQSSSEQSTDQVTFRLDGPQTTVLAYGRVLTAGTGSYVLTGIDASLLATRKLLAGVGSYALTGIAAGLIADRFLYAGVGSYTLSGVVIDLAIGRRKLYAFPRSGSVTRGIVRSGSVTRGITRSGYDPVKVRAYGG